jgi:hypothetical protein
MREIIPHGVFYGATSLEPLLASQVLVLAQEPVLVLAQEPVLALAPQEPLALQPSCIPLKM